MKKQNYHENELGKVSDSVKSVEFSERTANILSGVNDGDPIDPETQPVLAKINAKIKATEMINWAELSDQHLMSIRKNGERIGDIEMVDGKITTTGIIGNNQYDNFVELIKGLQGFDIKIDEFYW